MSHVLNLNGRAFWEMLMRLRNFFISFLLFVYMGQVWAHSDEFLDSQKSQNGGQVRMAGVYHLELVMSKDVKAAKENPITLYVTDHAGSKVPSAGSNASVTLLDGKTKSNIELKAAAENRFSGSGIYASNPSLKVVVSITAQGKQEQARFTPFSQPKQSHGDHKH